MWILAVYFAAVVLLVGAMLALSWVLGQRHRAPATGQPYESGIESEGSPRVRLSVRFYLIAMFFVIFDLEAAFLFGWAVAVRESGWPGFWEAAIFIAILALALLYLVRVRALEWSSARGSEY